MGKIMNTAVAFGAGMVALNYLQKNNMMNQKQMKKMQKRVMKMF
ncbi:MAG TPA: YrzQ family protein [Niallia sp.]|nr:YrzQ family protein [Niallia sp.]